ncbi:hypothetical protein GCM10009848_12290 [Micromonospora lupini]
MLQPLHHLRQMGAGHGQRNGQLVNGASTATARTQHDYAKRDVTGSVDAHEQKVDQNRILQLLFVERLTAAQMT